MNGVGTVTAERRWAPRWTGLKHDVADLRSHVRFLPAVTVAIVVAVIATAVRTDVFHHELPLLVSFHDGFSGRVFWSAHRWSSVSTSALLSRDGFMAVSVVASIAIALGLYEAIAGWWRAAIVALTGAASGPVLATGAAQLWSLTGNAFALRTVQTVDYGASTVAAAGGGALAFLGGRHVRVMLVAWLLIGSALHHHLADAEHLVSFAVGFGAAAATGRPTETATSSPRRRAFGVAGLVAAGLAGVIISNQVIGRTPVAAAASGPTPAVVAPTASAGPSSTAARSLSPPRIEKRSYPTPSVGSHQDVDVLLPAGYDDNTAQRYPVVEFLHGHPGNAIDSMNVIDLPGAALTAGVTPFIGLAPEGTGPVVADGYFADTSKQRLGAAVSDDLHAWAQTALRASDRWTVVGVSAGGYGAAYLATTRPHLYTAACAFSGNFTPEGAAFDKEPNDVLERDTPMHHVGPNLPPIMLVAGRDDQESVSNARRYDQAMTAAGQVHSLVLDAGGHDWALWRRQLPDCLRFLLAPFPRRSGGI
jgi:enterochelin esterase-like enzyme